MKEIELSISILKSFRERDSYTVELPSDIEQLFFTKQETKQQLANLFASGEYKPGNITSIEVPKPRGMLRHFVHMEFIDQLYYTWLIVKCFPKISGLVVPKIDNSEEVLSKYPQEKLWMQKYLRNNECIEQKQLNNLRIEDKFMFKSDITNFSPNIDHAILCKELLDAGVDQFLVNLLHDALDKWSLTKGRGLPQIFWATDILAEFYLLPLDRFMATNNYQYIRYNDNIEAYCENRAQSKKIFIDVVNFLSRRGMYLNDNKTIFSPTIELRNTLHGKRSITSRIKTSIKELPYDLSRLYYSFEESLGISNCKQRLKNQPQNTIPYLNHYYNNHLKIDQCLAEFLIEDEFEFEFQRYVILRWIKDHPNQITQSIIDSLLSLVSNTKVPVYTSSCAALIIAAHGKEESINKLRFISENIENPQLRTQLDIIFQVTKFSTVH